MTDEQHETNEPEKRDLQDLTVEEHLAAIRKHESTKPAEEPRKVALSEATVEDFVASDKGEVEIVKDEELVELLEAEANGENDKQDDDIEGDGGSAVAA